MEFDRELFKVLRPTSIHCQIRMLQNECVPLRKYSFHFYCKTLTALFPLLRGQF